MLPRGRCGRTGKRCTCDKPPTEHGLRHRMTRERWSWTVILASETHSRLGKARLDVTVIGANVVLVVAVTRTTLVAELVATTLGADHRTAELCVVLARNLSHEGRFLGSLRFLPLGVVRRLTATVVAGNVVDVGGRDLSTTTSSSHLGGGKVSLKWCHVSSMDPVSQFV